MELCIKTVSHTLSVHVDPTTTVLALKETLFTLAGHEVGQQRLIFGGAELCDENTLSFYNITAGSCLHLALRLQGGLYLNVETLDGKRLTMVVDPSHTFLAVKNKLEDSLGCPPDLQRLIYAGKELADDQLINIPNGCTIFLVLRPEFTARRRQSGALNVSPTIADMGLKQKLQSSGSVSLKEKELSSNMCVDDLCQTYETHVAMSTPVLPSASPLPGDDSPNPVSSSASDMFVDGPSPKESDWMSLLSAEALPTPLEEPSHISTVPWDAEGGAPSNVKTEPLDICASSTTYEPTTSTPSPNTSTSPRTNAPLSTTTPSSPYFPVPASGPASQQLFYELTSTPPAPQLLFKSRPSTALTLATPATPAYTQHQAEEAHHHHHHHHHHHQEQHVQHPFLASSELAHEQQPVPNPFLPSSSSATSSQHEPHYPHTFAPSEQQAQQEQATQQEQHATPPPPPPLFHFSPSSAPQPPKPAPEPLPRGRGQGSKPILNLDERIAKRMSKNRASAERSRQRKQAYVSELEFKLSCATSENAQLRNQVVALEERLAHVLALSDAAQAQQCAPNHHNAGSSSSSGGFSSVGVCA